MKRPRPTQDYPDPDDMFADTRMSFGEHIEDLRTHLIRAIAGFLIGMIAAFFVGKPVLQFIAKPVEDQLMVFWDRFQKDREPEILEEIRTGKHVIPKIRLDLHEVEKQLGLAEIRAKVGLPQRFDVPLENIIPGIMAVLERLDAADLVGQEFAATSRYISVKPDPYEYYKSTAGINRLIRPPMLSTLSVQEAFVVYFKVCLLSGLVISSPWVFWQIWAFVAAGLYPHEKRLVNLYMPFSLGLFLVGIFICEFFVIPRAIEALLWFNQWMGFQPDLRLNEWLGFAIFMPLVFGISFQTPLVMLFINKIGVFDVESYRSKRKIALLLMAVIAAVITPSTDAFSLMFLWVPMALLYEVGILLCQLSPREPWLDMEYDESEEMVEV